MKRTGEKIGWTGGWIGGFSWVFILGVVFLCQGKVARGLTGIAMTAAAVAAILCFAPWRFPTTRYWKLMLAPYSMFLLCLVWAVWAYGGLAALELNWRNLLWVPLLLFPLGSMSKRKWVDGERRPGTSDKMPPAP